MMKLTDDQGKASKRLETAICDFVATRKEKTSQTGRAVRDQPLREEDYGTFALFGKRGSGKTTVLHELREGLSKNKKCTDLFICWPPLDCSTLASDVLFGISLVSHVNEALEATACNGDLSHVGSRRGQEFEHKSLGETLEEKSKEVLKAYLPLDRHYHRLRLSLAVTSSEYGDIATAEILSRQKIKVHIDKWISEVVDIISSEDKRYQSIIIFLEDVDLAMGRFSSRVLTTFLHDFSSDRLLFLLTADHDHLYDRLQQEVSNAPDGATGATKERILAKLIPFHHRFYLRSWRLKDANFFTPMGQEEGMALGETVETVLAESGVAIRGRDIARLFPSHPRGLTDLYRGVYRIRLETDRGDIDPRRFVRILAECRGEESIAQKFMARRLDWWAARFSSILDNAEKASWDRIVAEARSSDPVWALEPGPQRPFGLPQGEDDALWMELLVNYSQRSDQSFFLSVFLPRFKPLRERLEFCRCNLEVDARHLIRHKSLLKSPWFRWSKSESRRIQGQAGWSSLIRSEDPAYELELLWMYRGLGIRFDGRSSGENRAGILPADVRSLLVLTHNISLLPWVKIQDWAQDHLDEKLLYILTLLCGYAYLQTLNERLESEGGPTLEAPQDTFDDLCGKSLEALHEEHENLTNALKPSKTSDSDHPMATASKAYFKGSWFTHPAGTESS